MVKMVEATNSTAAGSGKLRARIALLRVSQWVKNGFVLAPLFFSLKLTDLDAIAASAAAVAIFALTSSLVYVLNDWTDRAEDAVHPEKHRRPLASGALSGADAAMIAAVLAGGVLALGLLARPAFGFWMALATYVVLNVAYSAGLRHVELIDVAIIASGFVLRVLAGSAAIGVQASSWIVLSTGLLALLLALGKRRADLTSESAETRGSLDGYTTQFIDTALSALAAAVVAFYALFTVSEYSERQFGSESLYWTTFFVALGMIRFLQLVIAYERHGSPTDIALRDRPLQVLVVAWLITFYVLAYHAG